ncbi:Ldh family oxidoreductase [Bosea caraganae]|uniref:Ldh family oxidoreductase n=1 Tax=Bosea caraganae TaxID=2763117 RepID=A0A370L1Q0_9HYPH|nr:Ldh family oxidoreductase [Bosea caraganae]RDJ21486.1 Ldh family oxidoreductase [Bosea caraganae]RDJ23454.1 Ldh family oxidoreductase [Bosea caraganae]
MKLSLEQAEARVAELFTQAGASPANAASVAWALVMAEADGLKGHGLSRVPTYLAMLKAGKIDGQAVPIARRPKPGVLAIDAAHGFAYPAIDLAVSELPELARQQGIVAAPIRRSSHCGAAGLHVERLAEQGLVALLFANTPAAIAPWGGSKPVFGTNPIAFAAPLAGREPVVIDMALSKVARGPIVAARQKGESIPEGWALDVDGKPTTDAAAALAGTMVPLGDAKGATLAMMVEILAAALVGTHFAFQASPFIDDKGGPPDTGQLILAIDPAGMGGNWFAERMKLLAHAIEEQEGTRLPGVRRLNLREKAKAQGIEVAEEILISA